MPPKSTVLSKQKKRTDIQLERMLLEPIPQTPVPAPYFNIPSPEYYRFPLSETRLQGIKLLENYFPEDINQKIRTKLPNQRIERMCLYKNIYCMMGKNGQGLIVGDRYLDIKEASAFAYGPTHLVIAYKDLHLEIYGMDLKLIKSLKNFSAKVITFLKVLSVPKNFESIILLANSGNSLHVYRIEKSLFSTLSCKFNKPIIQGLSNPVTQIIEMPSIFRYYLRKDPNYRDCSLVCISAVNIIYILRINHFRLTTDCFWSQVYRESIEELTTNSVSWGEANIQAASRDIMGDKLMLMYSFGNKIYFLAFNQVEKFEETIKCQWLKSYCFELKDQRVAFCQYMKKNQILIVTQENQVLIFHTKSFYIFEKDISQKDFEILREQFKEHLQARMIKLITKKKIQQPPPQPIKIIPAYNPLFRDSLPPPQIQQHSVVQRRESGTEQEQVLIQQQPLVTYADTFSHEYPSNQIYFLTEKQFGIYMYCNWKLIESILKVEQHYESAMLFLIAMYKRANKFDLGVEGSEKELSQEIQLLTIDYINIKVSKIKGIPSIISTLTTNDQFFNLIITPIEFLTQTDQFDFLFNVAKDKIIAALMVDDSNASYITAQRIFYQALTKFIQHGRIKSIPDNQLTIVLDYYIKNDIDVVDRLAIYFDLKKIDRNVVIQCLLKCNLVVSLAHICTQGNESQFVTPFVRFWGLSQNHRLLSQSEEAAIYAFRALWYVKLCLQRNWVLKQYSYQKYAQMIAILSEHFLTEKIIVGLLDVRPNDCLQTLCYYFTIENSMIVNGMTLKLGKIIRATWIIQRPNNEQVELLLSAIERYINRAVQDNLQAKILLNLFVSNIIIYKTVKYTEEYYFNMLLQLIDNYKSIKQMKYGLQQKMISQYREQYQRLGCSPEDIDAILASRYITKVLTLVYYENKQYIHNRLNLLYDKSRLYSLLADLQSQLSFLRNDWNNCVEIYLRSRKCLQCLLFQFLQNTFKRLTLERRKQQKKVLAQCMQKQIKSMVALDPKRTKSLVTAYTPQTQQQLIQALSDDKILQLEYLQGIIGDDQHIKMKMKLSEKSILRFVQLMAELNPDHLIDAFKKNPHFSIEESLKICQKYGVYDCMEYLYERMGLIIESVKIAALRIDRILRSRDQLQEDNFAPYIKIKEILDNSIDVCKKNHSQEIWQSLLDSSIELYERYLQEGMSEDDVEIFFYINGDIMENLASNCSIQHTIDLIQNKYKDLNMGGKMTRAFINILANLSHSINILYLASNLVQASLQKYLQLDFGSKLQCYSTHISCETCHYSIGKREKSIHFKCGHCYHKQCVVHQDPITCVSCLMNKTDQFTYYLNTLNPKFPKIKKINELLEKYNQKRFQMSEVFKIEQYEKIQSKEQSYMKSRNEVRKEKLMEFDQTLFALDSSNREVQASLK